MIDALKKSARWTLERFGYSVMPLSGNQIMSKNWRPFSLFQESLERIDNRMPSASPDEIPRLFREIPLEVFGRLLLDVPDTLPNINAYFPTMAPKEVQDQWTGSNGVILLNQSLAFVKTLTGEFSSLTGKSLESCKILDIGFGWGRIIRLLYKFTSAENIYGIDPWNKSLEECQKRGVSAHLAQSEWILRTLPFDQKFDLMFAFSVFTHLSENNAQITLDTLRRYIADDGLLAITIRPVEFWKFFKGGAYAVPNIENHKENGFAYTPSKFVEEIDDDMVYGNTSISTDYFSYKFPQWRIVKVEYNEVDRLQIILFIRPS